MIGVSFWRKHTEDSLDVVGNWRGQGEPMEITEQAPNQCLLMIHFFIQQTLNEAYNVHWIRHCEYKDEQGTVPARKEFRVR